MITLYHGSPVDFDSPSLSHAKTYRDFGPAFYLAENENDALSIAIKDSYQGHLYTYEIDDVSLFDEFNVLELYDMGDDWLRFVYDCRTGASTPHDAVIGPTAGGRVNDIFADARKTGASFADLRDRLMREITDTRFGYQWAIASEPALERLRLIEKETVTR